MDFSLKFLETLFELALGSEILFLLHICSIILIIYIHHLAMTCVTNRFCNRLSGCKGLCVDSILGTIDQAPTRLPQVLSLYRTYYFIVVDCLKFGLILSQNALSFLGILDGLQICITHLLVAFAILPTHSTHL